MMDAIKAIKGVGSVQELVLIMLCAFARSSEDANLGVTISEVTAAIKDKTYRLLQVQLVKIY